MGKSKKSTGLSSFTFDHVHSAGSSRHQKRMPWHPFSQWDQLMLEQQLHHLLGECQGSLSAVVNDVDAGQIAVSWG